MSHGTDTPWVEPPPRADNLIYYGIWSMSGRYASYWNAFLFVFTDHFNLSYAHLQLCFVFHNDIYCTQLYLNVTKTYLVKG